jgi:hypothetical protein
MDRSTFRLATSADAEPIAHLHAMSWRRHYRGAYSDEYLDRDVFTDRLTVWSDRLSSQPDTTRTVIAELDAEPIGFVHTVLDSHQRWGALPTTFMLTRPAKGAASAPS